MPSTSLLSLVTSYRKAKVDLYYSSDPRRLDLVEYEEKLNENLGDLLERLEGDDESWATDLKFVGGFTFLPKRLDDPEVGVASFWSPPAESWRKLTERASKSPTAEFRLMSHCSIDFHVFSTLWML